MPDEIIESIRFAFDWRKRDFKKYYAYLVLLGLAWFFSEVFLRTKLDWMALMDPSIPGASYALLIALALTLLFSFFSAAVELLVLGMALKSRKQKTRKFDSMDFVTYFFLDFVVVIASLTSAFNPRGFVLLAGLVLFAVIALAANSAAAWALSGILFAIYVLVFFYNILRLSQTQFFFASQNGGLDSAMRNSLNATFANVSWLLLTSIAVFLGVAIVLLVAVGIPTLIVSLASGGFNSVPARIVSTVLSPVMGFSFLFAGSSIFALLLKRRKKKAEWKF